MSSSADDERRNNVSNSVRAGLTIPVGQTKRRLKEMMHGKHMGDLAAVAGTAAAEFLVTLVLKSSGDIAGNRRARITPEHVEDALKNDEQLKELAKGWNIADSCGAAVILDNDLKTNKEQQKAREKRKRAAKRAAAAEAAAAGEEVEDEPKVPKKRAKVAVVKKAAPAAKKAPASKKSAAASK